MSSSESTTAIDVQQPTKSSASGRVNALLWPLLIVIAAMHAPALLHPFFIDDYVYVEKTANINWSKLCQLFTTSTLDQSASGVWWTPSGQLPFYRPIAELTFAADYLSWGFRPFGFHLTNLLLHLLCTFLTWRLALRVFSPPYALVAAIVFALHPVHSEAVTWISGRFDLLVCACALASILSYLRWRDGSAGQTKWALWTVIWFILGLGCKETALILPVVILLIDFLLDRKRPHRDRSWLLLLATVCVISCLYLLLRCALFGGIFGNLPPPYGLDKASPIAAMRQLGFNGAQYLLDMVLCIHIEPAFLPEFWRTHPLVFASALGAALVLSVALMIVSRSKTAAIGLLWLGFFTAPSLLSMPGERNVYLAWVGAAFLVAAAYRNLLNHLPERTREKENQGGMGSVVAARKERKWRKIGRMVVAVWFVVCLVQQFLMGRVTGTSEKSYRDLQALMPEPPRDAMIYVVHQNPLNSVGFAQAIRLHYGRPDLSGCALSVSPTIYASPEDRAVATSPDTIQVVRQAGYFFTSFIERFYCFSKPAALMPESCRRCELELLNPPANYENLTSLEFRLPHLLDDPRLQLFYWDNSEIRGMLDFVLKTEAARMSRCAVQPTTAIDRAIHP